MNKYIIIFILLMLFKKDSRFDNFYQNIKLINNPNDINVLVNKNNKLPSGFIPSNLTILPLDVSNSNKYLVKEAAINYTKLSRDARNQGYTVIATSAYRDYKYQEKLYNYYVLNKGIDYADKCSARPGHSEHQTGLSLDVMGSNYDYDEFYDAKEYNWMLDNSYKYGFILRYPKDKEEITGFKFEPWHYRYVGQELATIIHDNDITLEEYFIYNH